MTTILNDVHIGFRRSGGTTPASQEALREYLLSSFRSAVQASDDLIILGDLFDSFEVDPRDWIFTYLTLHDHLQDGGTLTLVAGNHDHSPKANKVSSFQMLAQVLEQSTTHKGQLTVVGIDQWIRQDRFLIVAHCSNQDIFNSVCEEVLSHAKEGDHVFFHTNYDNNFAAQTDHSLNVSREMAVRFMDAGCELWFAHEHQARNALGGYVHVMGNQWPTSVADCLNNDVKYLHEVSPDMWSQTPTWTKGDAEAPFIEVDWRELDAEVHSKGFIRVTGTAVSNEASEVVNAISKFRQNTAAFVVTNAVKVDGIVEADSLPETFEVAKKFEVMDYIRQHLDGDEIAVVEELIKESQ